jgi:protoporphyrinogen oxidase
MTETPRVAIIGAGVSGLSCAYRLQQAGVSSVIIERSSTFGGRTKMADIAGELVPLAAGIVYAATESDDLCIEFGIDRFAVSPQTFSVHYKGVTVVAETDGQLAAGLPLGDEGRANLVEVLARMREEYKVLSEHGLTGESDELFERSFREYLGDVHPEVAEFFEGIVFAFSMARAEELSAKYALRYLSAKIMRDGTHSYYIPNGMGRLATELDDRLDQQYRFDTTVIDVTPNEGGGYRVRSAGPNGEETLDVEHVVLAVTGPEVAALVPDLPDWKRQAISDVGSVASITMGVVVDNGAEPGWQNVFMTGVVDGAFDYMVDPTVGTGLLADGRAMFQVGMWRERAEAAMDRPEAEIDAEWRAELDRIYPGMGKAILGTQVQKWPSCFAVPLANRASVMDAVTRPVGGIHFTGDYASEAAGTHGAIGSGARAAAEVVAAL